MYLACPNLRPHKTSCQCTNMASALWGLWLCFLYGKQRSRQCICGKTMQNACHPLATETPSTRSTNTGTMSVCNLFYTLQLNCFALEVKPATAGLATSQGLNTTDGEFPSRSKQPNPRNSLFGAEDDRCRNWWMLRWQSTKPWVTSADVWSNAECSAVLGLLWD